MAKRLIAEMMTRCGVAFDSSGARGPVTRMTDEVCYAYVAAFVASVAGDCAEIVLGYDARASSPRIAAACAAAILDAGRTVVHAGVVPASAVALAAWRRGAAGVMVTGGDAPSDRNGLRFFGPAGEPTRQDARRVAATEVDVPAAVLPASLGPVDASVAAAVVARLVDAVGATGLQGLAIGVCGDPGTDADLLAESIAALGARIVRIERLPSAGARWGRPDCAELDRLARDACARFELDAVVALDGDGTRPMLADETGAWRSGAEIAAISARAIDARALVVPVTAGGVFELCGGFETVARTRPGTRALLEALTTAGPDAGSVRLACDSDGAWLVLAEHAPGGRPGPSLPTREALLPIASLLHAVRAARMPVSALCAALPRRFTARNTLTGFSGQRGLDLLHRLAADPESAAATLAPASGRIAAADTTDGLRVRFENGDVVHLQSIDDPSGLSCATESSRQDTSERLCGECLARIVRQEAQATVSLMAGGAPVAPA